MSKFIEFIEIFQVGEECEGNLQLAQHGTVSSTIVPTPGASNKCQAPAVFKKPTPQPSVSIKLKLPPPSLLYTASLSGQLRSWSLMDRTPILWSSQREALVSLP